MMIELRTADGSKVTVRDLKQADEVQEAIAVAGSAHIPALRSGDLDAARRAMIQSKTLMEIADENEAVLFPLREREGHLRMADSLEIFIDHYRLD